MLKVTALNNGQGCRGIAHKYKSGQWRFQKPVNFFFAVLPFIFTFRADEKHEKQ